MSWAANPRKACGRPCSAWGGAFRTDMIAWGPGQAQEGEGKGEGQGRTRPSVSEGRLFGIHLRLRRAPVPQLPDDLPLPVPAFPGGGPEYGTDTDDEEGELSTDHNNTEQPLQQQAGDRKGPRHSRNLTQTSNVSHASHTQGPQHSPAPAHMRQPSNASVGAFGQTPRVPRESV